MIENISNIVDNNDCIALSRQTLCLWMVRTSAGDSDVGVLLRYIDLLCCEMFYMMMIITPALNNISHSNKGEID